MEKDLEKVIDVYKQYQLNTYNAILKSPKFDNFAQCSLAGNTSGMIESLINLPQVTNMKIRECFEGKNDETAESLLAESNATRNTPKHNALELLNKALLSANMQSKIYLQVVMERIRFWHKTSKFRECLRDVQYVTNNYSVEDNKLADFLAECKIECYLMESELYKVLGKPEKAKVALNKAMAELNSLAENVCSNQVAAKQTKQNLLQTFLQKLKKRKDKVCDDFGTDQISIPKLYGQPHNFLKSCSNSISLGYDEMRGRYLYATTDIPIGSTIIVDKPFSFTINQESRYRNCLHCYASLNMESSIVIPCKHCRNVIFCSEECRSESWKKYHQYECPIFSVFCTRECNSHLLLAYRTTISTLFTEDDKLNKAFFDQESTKNLNANTKTQNHLSTYDPLDYKTVSNLKTHCSEIKSTENLAYSVKSIFLLRCLEFVLKNLALPSLNQTQKIVIAASFLHHIQIVKSNAYEIVENMYDQHNKVWEPRTVGGAVYATVSLSNHSCYPNIVRHSYPQATVVVRTIRAIKSGEEILDNYGPHFLTSAKEERQEYLSQKYHFRCSCIACENDWSSDFPEEVRYKCLSCSTPHSANGADVVCCSCCKAKINVCRIKKKLRESEKHRLTAVSLMLEKRYEEALLPLTKHASFIEQILAPPNLEIIKTQQSVIQCFNSMSCTEMKG